MPGTAVMPPSSHCMSVMRTLGIHGRRFEAGPLIPPHHDIEVLDAIGRAALAHVVEGGDPHRATGARVVHHGDVHEIAAGHPAGRPPPVLAPYSRDGRAPLQL